MRRDILRWLERALLAVGVVLGLWCAKVIYVQHRTQALPIPEQHVTVRLPGDATGAAASSTRGTSGTLAAPSPGSVLGKLIAPDLGLAATVLEGSDDATLAKGAGHIEDTPLPGEPGNVGIAGHRDTIFRALRRVRKGEEFDVRTADGLFRYRVTRTLIVKPEDVYVLDPTPQPTLTLVTCWPFEFIGHAPKRFIVQAEQMR
ncbi:MAG TPA: class D sortase [Vicinamibacterales bacterium]|nr:class D sortase [Vicinamibacterales bacterium]